MKRYSNLLVLLMSISGCAMASTGSAHGSAYSPNPGVIFVCACGLILATVAHLSWKIRRTK